jgi:predicted enzyme related to lactoylglutathione lyase
MAVKLQVTFDAADPPALAAFWGETIGYKEEDPPEGFDSWEAKNRVHLDLSVSGGPGTPMEERRANIAAAVDRAVAAGATRLKDYDEAGQHWVVLQDPEGNEFCLH